MAQFVVLVYIDAPTLEAAEEVRDELAGAAQDFRDSGEMPAGTEVDFGEVALAEGRS